MANQMEVSGGIKEERRKGGRSIPEGRKWQIRWSEWGDKGREEERREKSRECV